MSQQRLSSWRLSQLQPDCNLLSLQEQPPGIRPIKNGDKLIIGRSVLHDRSINQHEVPCEQYERAVDVLLLWVSAVLGWDHFVFERFIAFAFLVFVGVGVARFEIELHEVVEGVELGEEIFGDDEYPEITCDLVLELLGSVLVHVVDDAVGETVSLFLIVGQDAENFQVFVPPFVALFQQIQVEGERSLPFLAAVEIGRDAVNRYLYCIFESTNNIGW